MEMFRQKEMFLLLPKVFKSPEFSILFSLFRPCPGYLVTVYEEDSSHVYTKSLLPARGVSITLLAISVH